MNEITKWNFGENEVRTIECNGEPWWVLADVCKVLELSTPARVAERLEEDEVSQTHTIDRLGRTQTTTIINESGLYSVILRSDKPQAKPFRKWVTSEVLPSIRKHGVYMTPDVLEQTIQNPDFMIQLCTELKAEQERRRHLETTVAVQEQQIQELKPKADYTDRILQNKGLVTITQIAKDYGMSGNKLNELLHELGVQYKQSSQWLLYAKYQDKGYTHSETVNITRSDGRADIKMNTKWAQKGRLFLYTILKANGILPIIEKKVA